MSATAIIIVVLVAVSLVCGSMMVRAKPFAVGDSPESLPSRVVQFLVGSFCWPIAATLLFFLMILFWDFWLNADLMKELMEEETSETR